METSPSSLESIRPMYLPKVPSSLNSMQSLSLAPVESNLSCLDEVAKLFPYTSKKPLVKKTPSSTQERVNPRVGVVFSGGQASGGHNVVSGLFDALQKMGAGELIGFLGGPSGIVTGNYGLLSKEKIDLFRNTGGFDLLGSGRTKIESKEQLESAKDICLNLKLDGLVIVGGDDSNTNAAVLAEYFHQEKCPTVVIGIPKTIDADLRNEYVPLSFGFDTACRVYSEIIGNIARDALSAKKYYHFIRLMGRSASHIALECALATHPNWTVITEEVSEKKMTLKQIVSQIVDLIVERASLGKNYGLILVPEGLLEWIPEASKLIAELNQILAAGASSEQDIEPRLTEESKECFALFPKEIQKQLLLSRDPHGNVQVSFIETERLLMSLVAKQLPKEVSFNPVPHFLGYEGRAAFPSNFDASYCYTLGHIAALAVRSKLSGYMCFVSNLHEPVENWDFGAVPLPSLMHMELRKGRMKPVIAKALVLLKGNAFQFFAKNRELWKTKDLYVFPGPMQFNQPLTPPISLTLEKKS